MKTQRKRFLAYIVLSLFCLSHFGFVFTGFAHDDGCEELRRDVNFWKNMKKIAEEALADKEAEGYLQNIAHSSIETGAAVSIGTGVAGFITGGPLAILPAMGAGYVGGSVSGAIKGALTYHEELKAARARVAEAEQGLADAKAALDLCENPPPPPFYQIYSCPDCQQTWEFYNYDDFMEFSHSSDECIPVCIDCEGCSYCD